MTRDRRTILRRSRRSAFTLVELLIAGVIASFILGSITMSFSQLGRAKNSSKMRFDAHLRADSSLNAIRRDIISILRSDDLFYCRLLLLDDSARFGDEEFDRDEIVVFNTRVRPLRDIDFNGEGFEYETHYRVSEDQFVPVLWQRRDPFPDEYPLGGGVATPIVSGVLGMMIEAYDGESWFDTWDSDTEGLPEAISITVVTSGHRGEDDIYDAPRAFLRTIVPIDRVLTPKDLTEKLEEEAEQGIDPEMIDGEMDPNSPLFQYQKDSNFIDLPDDLGSVDPSTGKWIKRGDQNGSRPGYTGSKYNSMSIIPPSPTKYRERSQHYLIPNRVPPE